MTTQTIHRHALSALPLFALSPAHRISESEFNAALSSAPVAAFLRLLTYEKIEITFASRVVPPDAAIERLARVLGARRDRIAGATHAQTEATFFMLRFNCYYGSAVDVATLALEAFRREVERVSDVDPLAAAINRWPKSLAVGEYWPDESVSA
jgi:hypothetical protein